MLLAGVDEAGRGCVIGPLVVAGITIQQQNLNSLIKLGAKDSKLLTPKKRETIYPQILQVAHSHHVIKIPPYIIDKAVKNQTKLHKLNRLEARTMAKVIQTLKPDHAYVDAADVLEQRFKYHIQECLTIKTEITSKHRADQTFAVVSAASIIAKVERDRVIGRLKVKFGDFGSGYLTDDKTIRFLKKLLEENGDYPSCVRKSWKPAVRVKNEFGSEQTKLFDSF